MSSTTRVSPGRFGDYRLIEKIGEGGMAEVFLAQRINAAAAGPVALKLLKPGAAPHVLELFATEADLMGLLRHPNLVELFEVGTHQDRLFIAMEYVEGAALRSLMTTCQARGRPFPQSVALRILIDVLTGLAYFHQATGASGRALDLVHGDVNPSNIFVSLKGTAKIGDFGAVQMGTLSSGLPEGMTIGKLHYLSPELLSTSNDAIAANDLFAVGVMLHELTLGRYPFDGSTQAEVMESIAQAKLKLPEVSREFEEIAQRALARLPEDRYLTAGALAGDLLRYQLDTGLFAGAGEVAEFVTEMREVKP